MYLNDNLNGRINRIKELILNMVQVYPARPGKPLELCQPYRIIFSYFSTLT